MLFQTKHLQKFVEKHMQIQVDTSMHYWAFVYVCVVSKELGSNRLNGLHLHCRHK